jgi:hypothetical protein
MRTKTLLLTAAAFAAGILSSLAQSSNVYSVNVVGYANVPTPAGFGLYVNQFNTGVSNGANEVIGSLADNSYFLLWNGSGFNTFLFDSTLGIDPGNWYDQNLNPSSVPLLTPGQAFFYSPGVSGTNTFAGSVIPNIGGTNSQALPAGYSMVGSILPVGGSATNAGPSTLNIPLSDNTFILQWNGSGYNTFLFDTSLGIDPGNWYDQNLNGVSPPSFVVGQGFFISPGVPANWTQTLPAP